MNVEERVEYLEHLILKILKRDKIYDICRTCLSSPGSLKELEFVLKTGICFCCNEAASMTEEELNR